MPSDGAVRRYSTAAWETAGHLVITAPTRTSLAALALQAENGQMVWVLSDHSLWVYDAGVGSHVHVGGTPQTHVTVSTSAGATPTAPAGTVVPPTVLGDMFINSVDNLAWQWDGNAWAPVSNNPTHVTVARAAGETPIAPGTTTVPTPAVGDIFDNPIDHTTWTYSGMAWLQIQQPVAKAPAVPPPVVTIDATKGHVPWQRTWATLPAGGDVFINSADGLAWVYNAAGTQWGQLPASSRPAVTVSAVSGRTPATAGALVGTPERDDEFINTTDNAAWIYDGSAWVKMPSSPPVSVTTSTTPGATPTILGGPLATPPHAGDQFVNTVDGLAWVYSGSTWVQIPGGKITVITSAAVGKTPTSTTGGFSGTPRMGDSFINTVDHLTWVYDGSAWRPINHDPVRGVELYGTIVETPDATIPSDYSWANIAAELPNMLPGAYVMVEYVPPNLGPVHALPGLASVPTDGVSPGDWVVALDTNSDGVPDLFRLVHHDLSSLPALAGHAHDVLAVDSTASGVEWVPPAVQMIGLTTTGAHMTLADWLATSKTGAVAMIATTGGVGWSGMFLSAIPAGMTLTHQRNSTANLAVNDVLPLGTVLRRVSATQVFVWAANATLHGTGSPPSDNWPDSTVYIRHA